MKNLYLVDLTLDKSKQSNYLSNLLIKHIGETLNENKKTILYLNKRWAYNLLICEDCSNIEKCPRCDIALSVHQKPDRLLCHHCWFVKNMIITCEKCWNTRLKSIWVWTQQIEDNIKKIFPNINIFRLDSDNIANKTQKSETLQNIKNAQIIIWTKMITTWFDFHDIKTIWVILLEQELQIPKYDTEEKIYSNIKQLLWRAWRLWNDSNVIIQTFIPENEMVKNIINLNYKDFFKKTLEERKLFGYPPFLEYCTLRYKNINEKKTLEFINDFKIKLDKLNNWKYEIIKLDTLNKRDNQFFWKIVIKWQNIRELLQLIKADILKNKDLVVIFE